MKKIFISQPMKDKTKEQIEKEREQAFSELHKSFGDDFEIIDSVFDFENVKKCKQRSLLSFKIS